MSAAKKPAHTPGIRLKIMAPIVPNFLRDDREGLHSVGDVSDAVLREVARQWTENLLRNAKRKREAGHGD